LAMDVEWSTEHGISPGTPALLSQDGLVLGNGDLSLSVYRSADGLTWRLGKSDVWDRRLDLSDDPAPAHIDEVARGIRDEGWKCPPYGGPVEATRGTDNPERMREICQGVAPSYKHRPYPCPKPVGEICLHLPPDIGEPEISQMLAIETGILTISCRWASGVAVEIECVVPPEENIVLINWRAEGWDESSSMPPEMPVWFSVYRWPDPTIGQFAAGLASIGAGDISGLHTYAHPKVTPLAPPSIECDGGLCQVRQGFDPDPTFPDGFEVRMAPLGNLLEVAPVDYCAPGEARLHAKPATDRTRDGELILGVTTTSDPGGAAAAMLDLHRRASTDGDIADELRSRAVETCRAFWSRSAIRCSDPIIENTWYEALHARRCSYRPDVPPPGMSILSSVADYSPWHGDYHMNFNLQSAFWGNYEANQIDLGDAYFKAMEFLLYMGRKIAHDYYNCRGAFVQLSGYPILAPDDVMGVVPMGRMAYMTGWSTNLYWSRYLHTMDTDWLANVGYPVIRECALFYADFLALESDGLYHAFPSNTGEDGFTGRVDDYRDRAQVLRHVRHCLRNAAAASEILGKDEDLRKQWREILGKLASEDGLGREEMPAVPRELVDVFAPEFYAMESYEAADLNELPTGDVSPWSDRSDYLWQWFFGKVPLAMMIHLRLGIFDADRDWPHVRELIKRWRRPNGLLEAYSRSMLGPVGAWTESLGIIAPIQEMMLQSWTGCIEVFPNFPSGVDCAFKTLRAQGAFLVSASCSDGKTGEIQIVSEKGCDCRVVSPWPGGASVTDVCGGRISADCSEGVISFATTEWQTYVVAPAT